MESEKVFVSRVVSPSMIYATKLEGTVKIEFQIALTNITPAENATWSVQACQRLGQLLQNQWVGFKSDKNEAKENQITFGTITICGTDIGDVLANEFFVRPAVNERRLFPIECLNFNDDEEGYESDLFENTKQRTDN